MNWTRTVDALPPDGIEVETKIDDANGCRNVQSLKFHSNLWWTRDMEIYVYYTPTHWRTKQQGAAR